MGWPLRSKDEGYRAQLTHKIRDKGGHEAYHLEASRNLSFPFLPRVPHFSFNNRVVLVITAYGPRAISGGTTCGKQRIGDVNKVPLLDNKVSVLLGICMKD